MESKKLLLPGGAAALVVALGIAGLLHVISPEARMPSDSLAEPEPALTDGPAETEPEPPSEAPPAPPAEPEPIPPPAPDDEAFMVVTQIEPRIPPPDPTVLERFQQFNDAVRSVASTFPGRLSVILIDLTTKERYAFRPADPYLPASTFKLPVALCTAQAIERGELTWDTPVAYTEDDYDPVGAGGFYAAEYGSLWPVQNLLERSLIHSNNVAVKMLARTLTWEGLWYCTSEMGGPVTRTNMGSTPVTAESVAAWWLALWQMRSERPELAESVLGPLGQVPYRGRIAAGTPRGDLVRHKFGSYLTYFHDGALVLGERPYILVVLTGDASEYQADQAIIRTAEAAWRSIYHDAPGTPPGANPPAPPPSPGPGDPADIAPGDRQQTGQAETPADPAVSEEPVRDTDGHSGEIQPPEPPQNEPPIRGHTKPPVPGDPFASP